MIYIYDVEVFKKDWIVVCKSVEGGDHIVIHNDNYALKQMLMIDGLLLGGFNNKHYDDAIIHAISHGADVDTVKELNDHIIGGKRWWDFPFLNYKRKHFRSFDLRDDLPMNLSLKAIEGNLGQSIVESDVDFRIDRKLTDDEIAETIEYCKTDVDNTLLLYRTRKSYTDSKRTVARLKGMDEDEALSMTNAKLTAHFLDAHKTKYSDEMEYDPPKELQLGKYEHVLQFFMDPVAYSKHLIQLEMNEQNTKTKRGANRVKVLERRMNKIGDRYDCDLETKVSGVDHKFAWGGIHGAIPNYVQYEQDGYKMVTIDVGSYYPSMMIEYNYISRSVPDPQGFADIYDRRMKAKHEGDKATSDALKLVLNTCYGAMKNRYNDLYDPRNASAICITGQLLLTDLVDKLESVEGFELIQSNTDGLMIRYPIEQDDAIVERVTEWEQRTRMNMEYTDIHAIAQKDVNNYVMMSGEVYYYKDGEKIVAEEDRNKLELKGGYVSLANGGSFENHSLVIVHKALVDYFTKAVPVETTINSSDDVMDFQIIAKTGSSYDGTYHQVNDQQVAVQKVNRVYATKNKAYGTIYKRKKNGRNDKIANLPDRCLIDNDNNVTIEDIDKEWYIDLAKKRVADYTGSKAVTVRKPTVKPKKKEDEKMTTKQNETKPLNIYQKISKVRLEFINANVKKSGINRFAEYKYFELADIVPVAMSLCDKYGLLPMVDFDEEYAYMHVVDMDSPTINDVTYPPTQSVERVTFRSPMRKLAVKGMNEIQALGGVETYQRRYLYMIFLDIVEADAFDATNGKPDNAPSTPKATPKAEPKAPTKTAPKAAATKPTIKTSTSNRPATPKERAEAKGNLINAEGEITKTQITGIKNGLKKLREKDEKFEGLIAQVMIAMKKGMSKTDAEKVLIKIGEELNS